VPFTVCCFLSVRVLIYAGLLILDTPSAWSRVLEKLTVTQSRNFPPFMEPEGSLPCSEEPTTGPYPKPDESIPQLYTLFI